MEVWQNWLCSWCLVAWWNIQTKVNPSQVQDHQAHPVTQCTGGNTAPVSGDDPTVARLLADDAVHLAVDPGGEGELHGAAGEPRDAAAAVGATAAERAILHGGFELWLS